jgi:hypothetical protein
VPRLPSDEQELAAGRAGEKIGLAIGQTQRPLQPLRLSLPLSPHACLFATA